ncbi:MAG: hypothetical protein V3S01_05730, partial [Dehalococcoidia bacterium]
MGLVCRAVIELPSLGQREIALLCMLLAIAGLGLAHERGRTRERVSHHRWCCFAPEAVVPGQLDSGPQGAASRFPNRFQLTT